VSGDGEAARLDVFYAVKGNAISPRMLCRFSCNIAGSIGYFAISGVVISNTKVAPAATSKAKTPPDKVILDIGYSPPPRKSLLREKSRATLERVFLL
jgi:hypothetical protein